MVLRAVILAGVMSLGAILLKSRRKKTQAGGGKKAIGKSGALNAFVELVTIPAAAADATATPRALHGLKFAVKDIFDVKGRVTGFGSPAWAATHVEATATAEVIAALQSAGAMVVGITHMDELACSIDGEIVHGGASENPAAKGRITGGSSSGSAVAVTAALHGVDFALGTDSGGGVRVPASCTGCYGFRPTHGAVSVAGVVPVSKSFDTVGWFARTPEVLHNVGRALLPPAPSELPERMLVLEDALDMCETNAQCTVASACITLAEKFPAGKITRLDLGKHLLMSCPALRAVQDAVATTGLDVLRNCFRLIMGAEMWAEIGDWYVKHKPAAGARTKEYMDMASKIAPESLAMLKEAREEVRRVISLLLSDERTVLILPTTPGVAPVLDSDAGSTESWRKKTLQLMSICSMCGFPQVTIPMTYSGGEGPYGLSLIAGPNQDLMCLAAAQAWGAVVAGAFPAIVSAEMSRPKASVAGTGADGPANGNGSGGVVNPGEEFKAKGNAEFKAGNFTDAVKLYTLALDKGSSGAPNKWRSIVLSNRAMTNLKLGAYSEAEEDCTNALKLDSKNVKAFLRRGAARSVSGNYLEALTDYESALRLEPKNKDAKSEILRMKDIIGDSEPIPDFDK